MHLCVLVNVKPSCAGDLPVCSSIDFHFGWYRMSLYQSIENLPSPLFMTRRMKCRLLLLLWRAAKREEREDGGELEKTRDTQINMVFTESPCVAEHRWEGLGGGDDNWSWEAGKGTKKERRMQICPFVLFVIYTVLLCTWAADEGRTLCRDQILCYRSPAKDLIWRIRGNDTVSVVIV